MAEVKSMVDKSSDTKQEQDLLRFVTIGSVDDGKSTLIGRLLYDTQSVYEDQLAAVEKTSNKKGFEGIDLSLITDGLAAEREQGITIDVAYRYFSTPKRKFIIADTPGHEQYTRNMVTGSSTTNLAIILIDARKGILDQSRRHAYITSLLGIPHLLVAINKMDLVDFSEDAYNKIVEDFKEFAKSLNIPDIKFVPVSALRGHNIVVKNPYPETENPMAWYQGSSVLEILETVHVQDARNFKDFRFPVQYVIRVDNDEHKDFRGFAGQIVSGIINKGDEVISLPSGKKSKVKSITTFSGELDEAFAPSSVTLTFEDEIDTSRGDIIVKADSMPQEKKELTAKLCWMAEEPMQLKKKYLIKHTTTQTKVMFTDVEHKIDINNLNKEEASELKLNEIGEVKFKTFAPLFVDSYEQNRFTGSFIVIDEYTNNTVGAGMIS